MSEWIETTRGLVVQQFAPGLSGEVDTELNCCGLHVGGAWIQLVCCGGSIDDRKRVREAAEAIMKWKGEG